MVVSKKFLGVRYWSVTFTGILASAISGLGIPGDVQAYHSCLGCWSQSAIEVDDEQFLDREISCVGSGNFTPSISFSIGTQRRRMALKLYSNDLDFVVFKSVDFNGPDLHNASFEGIYSVPDNFPPPSPVPDSVPPPPPVSDPKP